jgi:hypothetical protein
MTSGKCFNNGVVALDRPHIGFVMRETKDKIVVFGQNDSRFDIPKSKIIAVGRNLILGMNYNKVFQYRVNRDAPLPTGESMEELGKEEEKMTRTTML